MRNDDRLKYQRLVFYKDDVALIERVLQMFIKRSQAKNAILIDKDGHMITMFGQNQSYEMDTVCTLLAGTFAATKEWARLLGEDEFSVLFHQGKRDSIQVSLVGDRALLAVIFDQQQTQLGLIRLMCSEIIKKLEKIFDDAENRVPEEGEQQTIEEGFGDSAKSLLDDLFNDDM